MLTKYIISLFVITFLFSMPQSSLADDSKDYEYIDNGDGTCTITAYIGDKSDIVIPNTLSNESNQTLDVVAIGDGAFEYNIIFLPENKTNNIKIKKIVIPEGIKTIGSSAFWGNELTHITIPKGVVYIGSDAFWGNELKEVSLPDTVTYIGSGAFNYCDLSSFKLPNNPNGWIDNFGQIYDSNNIVLDLEKTYFGNNPVELTLENCIIEETNQTCKIKKYTGSDMFVVIPDSISDLIVVEIGYEAFSESNIASVIISDNVLSIQPYAFYDCGLESVKMPQGVTYIGAYAFSNNNLREVELPESIYEIGFAGFSDNNLVTIIIPKSLFNISDCAFEDNPIESVLIPEGVENIGAFAFNDHRMNKVDLPTSIKSIGKGAFFTNCAEPVLTLPTGDFSWIDSSGNIFDSGQTVSDVDTSYSRIYKVSITSSKTTELIAEETSKPKKSQSEIKYIEPTTLLNENDESALKKSYYIYGIIIIIVLVIILRKVLRKK